jgi:hypothetical protein
MITYNYYFICYKIYSNAINIKLEHNNREHNFTQ